jgi:ketosteroid isomerase-like protein
MECRGAMIDAIHRAYDARGRGDIEGLMAEFHKDAVFELKGERKLLQVAGTVEGQSKVRATLAGLIEAFEFLKRDIVDTVVEGDRAAVHSRLEIRFVPKDTVFVTDVLDMFRFESGKIIQLVEFADTALVKSVMSD